MACVDLPAFPLQLLLRHHPDWHDRPVAVVDCDKPQGVILWVNERARSFRILPGMRYAAALALARDLRAAEVPGGEIDRAVASLCRRLRRYTPHVEPAVGEPGVFWLDASGLERLHESLAEWAGLVRYELKRTRLESTVVVGFSRFGTYALARGKRGLVVLRSPEDERAAARRVPLDRLAFEPATRETLSKLGIRAVGSFVDLPGEGIHRRFGPEAHRLHRLAAGELRVPLQPRKPRPPALRRLDLDHAETDVSRLMLVIETLLREVLQVLDERAEAPVEILLGFAFDRMGDHTERIRPAAPTLDVDPLLDLIRLRLETPGMPDGVAAVTVAARGADATRKQVTLLDRPRRDPAAADRALARIRAEMGNDAVMQARLREGHLPEGSFTWEILDRVKPARPRESGNGTLVRRIYTRPLPLPPRPRQEPDGWMLRGLKQGPVVRVLGPYVVSGGWWRRAVHREYHFAETQRGDLLWVYYDRSRRRWYLHGRVE
jgi:protein ImuB